MNELVPSALTPAHEIAILDATNDRSIVRLVPNTVSESITQHSFEKPELFDKDEHELHKYLREQNRTPTATDNRLRLKFWTEYDRAMSRGEKAMNMVNVLAGVCSRELFYGHYLRNPHKVAWLLCPPTGYMVKAEEALEFGLEQLRDILNQPHTIGGKVDTKLGELKAKIVMMLDTRVKGAVVQKQMNLNVNTSNESVAKAAAAGTMEDLQRQLLDLERRNRVAQNLPLASEKPVIDVDPT